MPRRKLCAACNRWLIANKKSITSNESSSFAGGWQKMSKTERMLPLVILFLYRSVNAQDSSSYMDWIVKSACVDSSGKITTEDPYFGCASKVSRKVVAGDPLPYNNFEQMGYQICDSYVLLDSAGSPLYFHTFDYAPFNVFNQYSGSDGYDVYSISADTISVSNTKDGGGYGSTFFGSKCSYGNGWAIFPTTNFLSGGQGYWPISGVYWEHNGLSSPGPCPSSYSTNTLTSWELVKGFAFSGVNGNPAKSIDAMVSYHGFETAKDGVSPTDNFLQNGHLEVFYYTQLYGLTRWEVWFPVTATSANRERKYGGSRVPRRSLSASECSGTGTGVYKGITFTITDCHDWSQVRPAPSAVEVLNSQNISANIDSKSTASFIPAWPLVNANLLQHAHFEASGLSETYQIGKWGRFGTSPAGNLINWNALISTTGGDANDGTGMAYLAFNCGAGADGQCGSLGSQAIYQDVAVDARVCGGCTYLYGVNARTAPGESAGTLQIGLQLLDTQASGGTAVLWTSTFTETVASDNGDGRGAEAQSVYLSAKFVSATAVLPADIFRGAALGEAQTEAQRGLTSTPTRVNGAVVGEGSSSSSSSRYVLRFLVMPASSQTFHLSDAFFNRFPATNA